MWSRAIRQETPYDIMNSLAEAGGVVGLNYTNGSQYDAQHAGSPEWIIYGSETASSVNSRGVYDRLGSGSAGTTSDKLLTSYDNSHVGWGASSKQCMVRCDPA